MIDRPAILYTNWQKIEKEGTEKVTVLHIGTVADEDGSGIYASVEKENGEVIEVQHDRLKFTDKNWFNKPMHRKFCRWPF